MTLDDVRRLHALGLSVIPLKPRDKKPDADVLPRDEKGNPVWNPYQRARATEAELQAWFGNGVNRNVGIVTGKVSTVVVVESDTPDAEAWCVKNLPATPMMTRSARGFHRYYLRPTALPEIPALIKTAGGLTIEIKRDGQYVVGPGSVHPGKPEQGIPPGHIYAEVEPWPTTLADLPTLPMDIVDGISEGSPNAAPSEPLPQDVTEGSRNRLLFREGCRLRRLGWSAKEIITALTGVNRARCHPALDPREVEAIAHSCAKYEPAADTFPSTETGDAEFFAACYADTVRYDHRAKRWLLYKEHHWAEQTSGEVHRLALDAIRARQNAALKSTGDGRAKRISWALAGEARKRLTNQLALAENIKPIADAGDNWDADADLLGVQNGVIHLRTGLLRPGRPEDRITLVSPLPYDPNAATIAWKQFVLDVCDGNRELADYFQVLFGYILTGETGEQCFWIFYGGGSNGKNTLLEIITLRVIPNHSWSMNFPSAKWTDSMNDYQKAQLVGRRLIVSKENEQTARLNTEFIKSLTGDKEIPARHPYGRPFNFLCVGKTILAVNHKPTIVDETHGMWRRVRMTPFLRIFPLNPAFADRLVAEACGALAWAVEGAVRYYRDGLTTPKVILDATADYRQESNSLAPFFEECCLFGAAMKTKAQPMFDALRAWYDGRTPPFERLSQKEFGTRMATDNRFKVANGKGDERFNVFYLGVGLVDRGSRDDGPGI